MTIFVALFVPHSVKEWKQQLIAISTVPCSILLTSNIFLRTGSLVISMACRNWAINSADYKEVQQTKSCFLRRSEVLLHGIFFCTSDWRGNLFGVLLNTNQALRNQKIGTKSAVPPRIKFVYWMNFGGRCPRELFLNKLTFKEFRIREYKFYRMNYLI